MCYSLQGRKPQRKGIYLMHFIESCVVFSSRWEQRGLGGRELKPVPLLTSATRKALKVSQRPVPCASFLTAEEEGEPRPLHV